MILLPPSAKRAASDRRTAQDVAAGVGVALPDVAVLALQQGRVIEAIKLIRTANPGLDLARAKAALERMQHQARATDADEDGYAHEAAMPAVVMRPAPLSTRRPPTVAMGDPPGQLRWLLVVVALLVAATWIAFGGA